VTELNARFREYGIGYQYENGEIVRVESQFIHTEVVKPALALLGAEEYAEADAEFLKALEHYRKGETKECLERVSQSIRVHDEGDLHKEEMGFQVQGYCQGANRRVLEKWPDATVDPLPHPRCPSNTGTWHPQHSQQDSWPRAGCSVDGSSPALRQLHAASDRRYRSVFY